MFLLNLVQGQLCAFGFWSGQFGKEQGLGGCECGCRVGLSGFNLFVAAFRLMIYSLRIRHVVPGLWRNVKHVS